MNIPGVDKLIGRLEDVLAKEAKLIWRVPGEVKDFKGELEYMQLCLKVVDRSKLQPQFAEGVEMKWVADIRDKAYEAEDIIDEFTYHMTKQQRDINDDISCLSWFLQLVIDAPTTLWVMHQTAHKLQEIKKSITDIADRHTKYKSIAEGDTRYKSGASAHDAGQQQAVRNLRDGAYFIEEETFIGFHRQIESLKKWLIDDKSSRAVISVYGMGGAGKTTLAANIYKTQKSWFDLSAWVTISQTYSITELLRSLIKNIANINKGVNESYLELGETLRDCLKGKKYLIVFDDVWDTLFWEQMKVALPEDKVGSRILVTTRDERNAPPPSNNVKSHRLPVGQLQGSEPWDLFSMKAFADCLNKTCPPELDLLARKLVEKCRGLPLALVTLGGHMSSKKQKEEWIDANKSLYKTPDMNGVNVVNSILMLSFSGLPYLLKHCFLYCCLYPEDSLIRRKRLIRRWIAEGFVEGGDGKTPEEVADLWLSELVFRSMLLVETRNVSGRPKVIKMHDVMREFALEIAKKEKFCGVYDGREAINEFEAYRWSIQFHPNSDEELKLPSSDMSRVRSLSVFSDPSFLREHLLKFKMLRLLDLEDSKQLSEFPHEVGNLFNLRYLNLNGTSIKKLPSSIGRLLNLQTLDISWTSIIELPEGVSKLRKLRHLTMGPFGGEVPIAFDISKLNKLQVLTGVRIDKGETLRQLGTLTQLTRLDISVHHDGGDLEERRKNWEALGQLKLLQHFYLDSEVDRDLKDLIILPLNLKKFHLGVLMREVRFQSRWFDSLHNIQHMTLKGCTVSGDQLPWIAALETLVSLQLKYFSSEEVLHFYGGFAKLKQLSLISLYKLKEVIFEKGVMPHIEKLSIHRCRNLQQSVPEGIEHLTNLQKLELEVPKRLKDSYEEEIKNWKSKVQHIPTIHLRWLQ